MILSRFSQRDRRPLLGSARDPGEPRNRRDRAPKLATDGATLRHTLSRSVVRRTRPFDIRVPPSEEYDRRLCAASLSGMPSLPPNCLVLSQTSHSFIDLDWTVQGRLIVGYTPCYRVSHLRGTPSAQMLGQHRPQSGADGRAPRRCVPGTCCFGSR